MSRIASAWATVAPRTRIIVAIAVLAGTAVGLALLPGPAAGRTGQDQATSTTPAQADEATWYEVRDGEDYVDLYFGWSSSCPHCAAAKPFVLALPEEHPWLVLHSLQVDGDNEANRQFLIDLAASIDQTLQSVPAFLYAERLEVGWDSPLRISTQS